MGVGMKVTLTRPQILMGIRNYLKFPEEGKPVLSTYEVGELFSLLVKDWPDTLRKPTNVTGKWKQIIGVYTDNPYKHQLLEVLERLRRLEQNG